MRDVRSELLSVAEVLGLPLMIAAAFPCDAIRFHDAIRFPVSRSARSADDPTASIVFLDEASVARAERAARTVSRHGDGDRVHVDLLSIELPPAGNEPMAAAVPRRVSFALPVVENGVPPFLPSRRAAAPVRISAETVKDEPAFSREELLKLN